MKVHTIKCPGQAHTDAHIDNCGLCMGHTWGALIMPADNAPAYKTCLMIIGKRCSA